MARSTWGSQNCRTMGRCGVLVVAFAIVAASCSGERSVPAAEAAAAETTTEPARANDVAQPADSGPERVESTDPPTTVRSPAAGVEGPPTPSPDPEPDPVTEADQPAHVTMAFSGDTLPHSPLWRRAARNAESTGASGYDFTPMLSGLAPVVAAADLAICHLETPIAPAGEPFSTSPRYGVPEEIADAIVAAGYDRCSTASNHTYDRGTTGIDRTVDVLESRGLGQSGMARTPAEIRPHLFDVNGITFSHLSYTFSYNGLSLPDDQQWRSAVIDPQRIIGDAEIARVMGADVVVVSMHWGAEGVHQPTGFQRQVADEITASGAIDLVVGHHAHVVQPIERINGVWVMFGLGNILSNLPTSSSWPAASQDAVVATVDVTIDHLGAVLVTRPVVHPTWVDKDAGWTAVLVEAELARDDISEGQRGRLERSLDRTRSVLSDYMAPGDAG